MKEFLSELSFRFIKPNMHLPQLFFILKEKLEQILPFSIETIIIGGSREQKQIKKKLASLVKIPHCSTIGIGILINKAISMMPVNQAFVNVGVWHGFTFLAGMIDNPEKTCIGIDNFSEFGGPKTEFLQRFNQYKSKNHFFYEMDYQEYFKKKHQMPIGVYIYDGNHSYENQLEGLRVAEPYFAKGCIIIVDDINLCAAKKATLKFINSKKNQYQLLLYQPTPNMSHPTFWDGIMIFQKI